MLFVWICSTPLTSFRRRFTLPSESFFLLLDFGVLEKDSARSSEIFVEHIRGRLLGYGFEPRPVVATVGSAMSIGLSINGCSHSKKTVWRERTRLTSPKVWAAVTWQKGLTWFRQSNRHLAFYQELESRLRKIAINGHFLCLTCKVTHKYALCIISSTSYLYCWKKLKKSAFSLKNCLTACYLWHHIA